MKIKISENLRVLFLFFVLGLLGKILMQGKIESRRKRAEGKGHERSREGFSPEPGEGGWPWRHLHVGCLASRTDGKALELGGKSWVAQLVKSLPEVQETQV